MKERLAYFDQMKGLAIILVVIGHVMQFSFGYKTSDVVDMLGVFHMPIFFYISGYFMYKVMPSTKEMFISLCKRSLTLVVPFFVFSALWCVFSRSNYISMILSGGERYWFLWVLFLISFFFIAYGYVLQKIRKEWLYILLWIAPYCMIMIAKVKGIGGVIWCA